MINSLSGMLFSVEKNEVLIRAVTQMLLKKKKKIILSDISQTQSEISLV